MNEKLFGIPSRRAVLGGTALTLGALNLSELFGQGPGGGGRGAPPIAPYDDYTGFTKLWDGRTFTNWDGETDVWSIDHDAVHADTVKTPGQHHIHYVGPNAIMGDFDLKVEMKMSAQGANGGIQYRSRLLGPGHNGSIADPMGKNLPPNVHTLAEAIAAGITSVPSAADAAAGGGRGANPLPAGCPAPTVAAGGPGGGGGGGRGGSGGGGGRGGSGGGGRGPAAPNPWQVSGYQYDMNSANNYTGQLYEGQGRGIVNPPGGIVILQPCRVTQRIGTANANPAAAVHEHKGVDGEWNQIEIIAYGNTMVHMMNGQVITVSIDNNPADRATRGIMSLQLEGSGQIWYRNVYVKQF
jgi:hypothetical protein